MDGSVYRHCRADLQTCCEFESENAINRWEFCIFTATWKIRTNRLKLLQPSYYRSVHCVQQISTVRVAATDLVLGADTILFSVTTNLQRGNWPTILTAKRTENNQCTVSRDMSSSLFTAACDPLWNHSKVQFTVICDPWLNTWSKWYSTPENWCRSTWALIHHYADPEFDSVAMCLVFSLQEVRRTFVVRIPFPSYPFPGLQQARIFDSVSAS